MRTNDKERELDKAAKEQKLATVTAEVKSIRSQLQKAND